MSGELKYAGDFPRGFVTVLIPAESFANVTAGKQDLMGFAAFDGAASWDKAWVPVMVNDPPVIHVSQGGRPVVLEHGQKVELPFTVTGQKNSTIRMFYKFDNEADWSPAPPSESLNVFPGDIFAFLDPTVKHTMEVRANGDHGVSTAVVSPGWLDVLKIGGRLVGAFLGGDQSNRLPDIVAAASLPGTVVIAALESLMRGPMTVSYRVDGTVRWSNHVSYPLGEHQVFVFGNRSEPYAQPGAHCIVFQFQDAAGRVYEDRLKYIVNSPPSIQLTSTAPLSFNELPTSPVSLPIAVSDVDNDPVKVFYRFKGDSTWLHAETARGGYVIPADTFSEHLKSGGGVLELFAWDGAEPSHPLELRYSALDAIEKGEEEQSDVAEKLSDLPPAGIVGIAVAGVAVIVLVLAIVLLAWRRGKSSTAEVSQQSARPSSEYPNHVAFGMEEFRQLKTALAAGDTGANGVGEGSSGIDLSVNLL
jgi:hypothetical protein